MELSCCFGSNRICALKFNDRHENIYFIATPLPWANSMPHTAQSRQFDDSGRWNDTRSNNAKKNSVGVLKFNNKMSDFIPPLPKGGRMLWRHIVGENCMSFQPQSSNNINRNQTEQQHFGGCGWQLGGTSEAAIVSQLES